MKSYKPILILLLSFVTVGLIAAPGELKEYTKTIEQEYDITADGNTSISNKHGKIEIKTWDQNKVKIHVLISVDVRAEEDAQKVFDRISIDFENSSGTVSAKTVFDQMLNRYWNKRFRDLSIDFEVYLPATNNLRVKQSHGKVYIADMKGNADLDMSHADFWAKSFGGEVKINISHGNGTFENAGYVDVDLSHAKLHAQSVADADVNCSHGTFDAEKAVKVKSSSSHSHVLLGTVVDFETGRSNHDKIKIGAAERVRVNGGHTVVAVKEVSKSLDSHLQHGSCRVGIVGEFSEINLEGSHASFTVLFDENARFRMDASSQHGGIHYPGDMQINYHVEKNSNKTVKGYYGSEDGAGMLKARLSHGSLKVNKL